ncbi:MAG: lipocalin-like domain-containing protein [Bacteroidales bacterium]|jgi:hypothetical protein
MKRAIIFSLSTLFLFSCIDNPFKKPVPRVKATPKIVGTWTLLVLKSEDPEGHFQYPYDVGTKGLACFDTTNNFSIQYYDATRPGMRYDDPFFCSDPEIRIAFLSANSFYGSYNLFRDSVQLNIKASLNPNFSGTVEKWYYRTKGDTMLLVAPGKNINGVHLKEYTVWLRSVK